MEMAGCNEGQNECMAANSLIPKEHVVYGKLCEKYRLVMEKVRFFCGLPFDF